MRVAVRDLRNDTRGVIDAVERGEDVVLTRRGRAIARIVPFHDDEDNIEEWLESVTRDAVPTALLDDLRAWRDEDDDADRRRESSW